MYLVPSAVVLHGAFAQGGLVGRVRLVVFVARGLDGETSVFIVFEGGGAGHAFAAAISACASGGNWARALKLFDEMLFEKIQPDVVSCTALVTALASDGQYERAQSVINWMTQVTK